MATGALAVIFIASLLLWTETNAYNFKCYSCSMSGGDVDRKCLTDPAAVSTSYPFVNCNKKYCIIIRIEENDPPGQIFSFRRGCEYSVQEGVVLDRIFTFLAGTSIVTGQIFSFRRGCEDSVQEGVVVDSARTTYTRKCTSNLCNDWDGIAAKPGGSGGGGGGSGSGGETGAIITKGDEDGGATAPLMISASALVCLVFLLRFCH